MQLPFLSGIGLLEQVTFIPTQIPVINSSAFRIWTVHCIKGFSNSPPFRAQQKCGPIAQDFYKDLSALHYYGLSDRQATFAETRYTFLKTEVGRPARLPQAS